MFAVLIELVSIYEYCGAYGWQSLNHFQCHKVSIIYEIIKVVTKNVNFLIALRKAWRMLKDAIKSYLKLKSSASTRKNKRAKRLSSALIKSSR